GSRVDGEDAGTAYAIKRAKLAGFENYLEMRLPTGFLDRDDLVEHALVVAGKECTARNHHVDLVRAFRHGDAHVFELDAERCHPARKRGGDGCDLDVVVPRERLARHFEHGRIYADRGDVRQIRPRIVQMHCLLTELPHLARRILTLERGQVDHAERQLQGVDLRVFLDAARAEAGYALVHADFID